ncbi:MAG: hypothetical protein L3J37_05580 [Rhodobacteraceae bacterium]|nr:hypothetical protein [Paracoccaceae bacterium]
MERNTKVILTQKWWKENKPKTLTGKGNLGETLKNFEGALTSTTVAKGQEQGVRLKVAQALCDALDTAAARNAKACLPKAHAETKFVLQNTFPPEVEKHRKLLDKKYKDLKKKLLALTAEQMVNDRTYRVLYMAMAKKHYNDKNINFVLEADGKNAAIYEKYIKSGAPQQINIDHSLRARFDDAMRDGKIGNAPWSKAVKACLGLINSNDMGPKFAKFVLGE